MLHLVTAQADVAHAAAYDDRDAHAEMLLRIVVDEAVALIRAGEPGKAEYRMTRVGLSAERILGPGATA